MRPRVTTEIDEALPTHLPGNVLRTRSAATLSFLASVHGICCSHQHFLEEQVRLGEAARLFLGYRAWIDGIRLKFSPDFKTPQTNP